MNLHKFHVWELESIRIKKEGQKEGWEKGRHKNINDASSKGYTVWDDHYKEAA